MAVRVILTVAGLAFAGVIAWAIVTGDFGAAGAWLTSDPWGLTRYMTEDLFRCEALVRGVPDLRFLRRRGIKYHAIGCP